MRVGGSEVALSRELVVSRREASPVRAEEQTNLASRVLDEAQRQPTSVGARVLRTLHVEFDHQHIRHWLWRAAVAESHTEIFTDFCPQAPAVMAMCQEMERDGGSPKLWYAEWCHVLNLSENGCLFREVGVLVESVWQAATCDQQNLGCMMCVEVLGRRRSQVVDATGLDADWNSVRHFSGVCGASDIVPAPARSRVRAGAAPVPCQQIDGLGDSSRHIVPL